MKHKMTFVLWLMAWASALAQQQSAIELPTMGWSSWNTYRVNISDSLIKRQADAIVAQGLKDAGYTYINIDDGFFGGRDKETGRLKIHPTRFPAASSASRGSCAICRKPDWATLPIRLPRRRPTPGWGYMVENGATTIWELWNGNTANPSMNSGNHVMMLGDLVPWASYPSIYGDIVSNWKREGESIVWHVTIPANTTATLFMPDGKVKEIGSGSYSFKTKSPLPVYFCGKRRFSEMLPLMS